jgi:hypothetical protein
MKVFSIPGQGGEMDGCCIESKQRDTENKFVEATAELVCEILNIGWNDRRIVQSLLVKGLSEKMNNRWKDPGLLQQYGAYVLEEAGSRFYYELGVPKEVKINHDNAEHAKYASLATWIQKNYRGPVPEPESKEIPNPTNPKSNPEENARG